jgi:hypothetical protein
MDEAVEIPALRGKKQAEVICLFSNKHAAKASPFESSN